MAQNLNKDFEKQLKKYLNNVDRKGTKEIRGVGLQALTLVMFKSPVDEGVFRANWKIGIDSIDKGFDIGNKNAQGAMSEGKRRLGSLQSGSKINVSNALPYAMRLEFGYSAQASSGIVRPVLIELVSWLKTKNKKV